MRPGIGYQRSRMVATILLFAYLATPSYAQHLRIFACAISNDSAGASMGASSNGSGLYQSDDTGKTWRHLGWDNIKCYSMDMVQSSNGRILYEATGLGILRSTDYGAHWKQITDWRISEAMDVAVNQKNPNEIYIATAHGPWRTKDGGKTWDKCRNGLPGPFCSRIVIDSSDDTHILLGSNEGLYNSYSKSKQWTKIDKWNVPDSSISPLSFEEMTIAPFHSSINGITQRSRQLWFAASEQGGMDVIFDSLRNKHRLPLLISGYPMAIWSISGMETEHGYYDRAINSMVIEAGPSGSMLIPVGNGDQRPLSFDTVKNVATSLALPYADSGAVAFLGSLDSGIIRITIMPSALRRKPDWQKSPYLISSYGATAYNGRGIERKEYLPHRQIWTLKSFLVTP